MRIIAVGADDEGPESSTDELVPPPSLASSPPEASAPEQQGTLPASPSMDVAVAPKPPWVSLAEGTLRPEAPMLSAAEGTLRPEAPALSAADSPPGSDGASVPSEEITLRPEPTPASLAEPAQPSEASAATPVKSSPSEAATAFPDERTLPGEGSALALPEVAPPLEAPGEESQQAGAASAVPESSATSDGLGSEGEAPRPPPPPRRRTSSIAAPSIDDRDDAAQAAEVELALIGEPPQLHTPSDLEAAAPQLPDALLELEEGSVPVPAVPAQKPAAEPPPRPPPPRPSLRPTQRSTPDGTVLVDSALSRPASLPKPAGVAQPTSTPKMAVAPPSAAAESAAVPEAKVTAQVAVPAEPPTSSHPSAKSTAAPAAETAPAAEGPKQRLRRPWWEELFAEDFSRASARPTESQIHQEVTFIEESLGVAPGGVVLDLGCGAGYHATELASRGYGVVGYDLSLYQLALAADVAQDAGQKLNLLQGDMREMAFEETFDGIYCWNTTFGYFEEEKNVAVAQRILHALKSGGTFLVDVINRDFASSAQPSSVWYEGDACVCMDDMSVDFITSRLRVKRSVILDDGKTRECSYSIRLYSLHELGRLLHDVGFRVTEASGHYATRGVFLGQSSPRIIILAQKP